MAWVTITCSLANVRKGLRVQHFVFKLYITGRTARSQAAVTNLRQLCSKALPDAYQLEIIDVLERPELAEHERIIATPTLVRHVPPPERRVIGDLSQEENLRLILDGWASATAD